MIIPGGDIGKTRNLREAVLDVERTIHSQDDNIEISISGHSSGSCMTAGLFYGTEGDEADIRELYQHTTRITLASYTQRTIRDLRTRNNGQYYYPSDFDDDDTQILFTYGSAEFNIEGNENKRKSTNI